MEGGNAEGPFPERPEEVLRMAGNRTAHSGGRLPVKAKAGQESGLGGGAKRWEKRINPRSWVYSTGLGGITIRAEATASKATMAAFRLQEANVWGGWSNV